VKAWIFALALGVCAPAWPASEDGFYAKRVDYAGIAIKAHASVDDRALVRARDKVARMLGSLAAVRANLAAAGAELHIIGAAQSTSDLPENRHLKGRLFQGTLTLDERTRGVGGLLASCGEENLLELPSDRYAGRDICVHEFAHAIYGVGMDEATRTIFQSRYEAAKASGRWAGFFAETNADEFFAELSMEYFGSERGTAWLAAHDPESFALLDRFYRGRLAVKRGIWPASRLLTAAATLRSVETPDRARLLIRNRTADELQLYWFDFDGTRRAYGPVPAFGFVSQETFDRHAWVLVAPDGSARAFTVTMRPGSILVVE
jgi:hypothetical protein